MGKDLNREQLKFLLYLHLLKIEFGHLDFCRGRYIKSPTGFNCWKCEEVCKKLFFKLNLIPQECVDGTGKRLAYDIVKNPKIICVVVGEEAREFYKKNKHELFNVNPLLWYCVL